MTLTIHTDGGSRGNPGPAAIGIVIEESQGNKLTYKEFIGITTNNIAEYTAVSTAIQQIESKYKTCEVEATFFLDSELVVKQLNNLYKVKDLKLKSMYEAIQAKIKNFKRATFLHVYRESNKEADALVNTALDARLK